MRSAAALAAALATTLAPLALDAAPPAVAVVAPRAAPAPTPVAGVALGLFSEDAGFSYRPLLDEIRDTGADHVELVVPLYLADVHASDVHDHPRFTPPPDAVARAVRDAHRAGLAVLLFPILRLERAAAGEWRGTLAPRDRPALLASYTARLVALARLAERERVAALSVGSELSTLDVDRAAWAPIVAAVRRVYHGRLTYSGNWDHYRDVALYDLVDDAGACAYFRLHEPGAPDGDDVLLRRWRELRAELEAFSARIHRPLLLTEVGYLSQRGATAWPWEEGAREPVDLEEQRRAYEALRRALTAAPPTTLAGLYVWNWYGWGGETSGGYTPRGKPAAAELRRLFFELAPPEGVRAPAAAGPAERSGKRPR